MKIRYGLDSAIRNAGDKRFLSNYDISAVFTASQDSHYLSASKGLCCADLGTWGLIIERAEFSHFMAHIQTLKLGLKLQPGGARHLIASRRGRSRRVSSQRICDLVHDTIFHFRERPHGRLVRLSRKSLKEKNVLRGGRGRRPIARPVWRARRQMESWSDHSPTLANRLVSRRNNPTGHTPSCSSKSFYPVCARRRTKRHVAHTAVVIPGLALFAPA